MILSTASSFRAHRTYNANGRAFGRIVKDLPPLPLGDVSQQQLRKRRCWRIATALQIDADDVNGVLFFLGRLGHLQHLPHGDVGAVFTSSHCLLSEPRNLGPPYMCVCICSFLFMFLKEVFSNSVITRTIKVVF